MQAPLQPTSFGIPAGLDTGGKEDDPSSNTKASQPEVPGEESSATEEPATPPSEEEAHEAFANLKDERHFEQQKRKAQLVMGPPLGEETNNNGDVVVPGQELAENEAILAELPDDAEDLEMTHMRILSLRGLGIERFRQVERISLRQNLLSSLSYVPATTSEQRTSHTLSEGNSTEPPPNQDELDEDSHDDEDAQKKEAEFDAEHRPEVVEKRLDSVWPLRGLEKLEELDLYDNRLKSVRGIEGLVSLKSLDLSFNLLRSIAPLDDPSPDSPFAYPHLDHLYLIQNKLSKIEGVAHRTSLNYLEFGGNRIRKIENLPISSNLTSLFLGKNKITKIENLEGLTGLRTLSIQSNRLLKIEGLETLTELEELYLSHNGLTTVEGLSKNTKLTTLDIGNNKITNVPVEELANLPLLEEFWANDNQIATLPILTAEAHPNLETIYLEGNPVQKDLGTAYNRRIMLEMPQLKQIDANFIRKA